MLVVMLFSFFFLGFPSVYCFLTFFKTVCSHVPSFYLFPVIQLVCSDL